MAVFHRTGTPCLAKSCPLTAPEEHFATLGALFDFMIAQEVNRQVRDQAKRPGSL